jgi:hypothetical protein
VLEIALRLFHIEVLAEAEIPKNVEDKVVDLISHVQRLRPFAICAFLGGFFEQLDPSTGEITVSTCNADTITVQGIILLSVRNQERLHAAKRTVRESIIEHSSLASMLFDIGSVPGIEHLAVVRPGSEIRLSLNDIAFGTEDRLECRRSVHDYRIGTVSENRSWWPLVYE